VHTADGKRTDSTKISDPPIESETVTVTITRVGSSPPSTNFWSNSQRLVADVKLLCLHNTIATQGAHPSKHLSPFSRYPRSAPHRFCQCAAKPHLIAKLLLASACSDGSTFFETTILNQSLTFIPSLLVQARNVQTRRVFLMPVPRPLVNLNPPAVSSRYLPDGHKGERTRDPR